MNMKAKGLRVCPFPSDTKTALGRDVLGFYSSPRLWYVCRRELSGNARQHSDSVS